MGISHDELKKLFYGVKREAIRLEMRDGYGTVTELPHLAKWKAGEPDDYAWLRWWCDMMRAHVAAGRVFRRLKVVSEPLSEYQQWSLKVTTPMVEAGEDIRWVPRRLLSEIFLPGNDVWMFDDEVAVFHHYAGSGLVVDRTVSTDHEFITEFRATFERVWPLGIPHREYEPNT